MSGRLYPSRALHGQVVHKIGRRIVSGGIAEGAFLPREAELQRELGVSRQVVREALKVLAAKGLITSRRRAGTFVMPRSAWNLLDPDVLAWHKGLTLSPEFVRDMVELRYLIEPAAAMLAAKRAAPDAIARIRAALDAMRQTVDNTEEFHLADVEFHIALFAASGNALIGALSTIMRPLLDVALALQRSARTDNRKIIDAHAAVYDAIVAADPQRSRASVGAILALAAVGLETAIGSSVRVSPLTTVSVP